MDNGEGTDDDLDFIAHPDLRVRDLSYSRSRIRQLLDLTKGSFFDMGFGPRDDDPDSVNDDDWPDDRLEIYIKEKSRGPGYVCDIVYHSESLPVTVYAVLINRGHGLEIAELELFRRNWGCFDDFDNYLHLDDQDVPITDDEPPTLITSDVLRRIPLGDIIGRVERDLPDDSWREKGIRVFMGPDLAPDDLTDDQRRALENYSTVTTRRRGRPELSDDLLIDVADAYISEAPRGRGVIRRLSATFDRPEPTIRDWVAAARRRGFLAPTTPGRRGAAPGPNLPSRPTRREYGTATVPNLSRERRRHILRLVEGEGLLDADLSEDARLLYVVGGFVCNDVGFIKQDNLQAAMKNPEVVQAALMILDKARRRAIKLTGTSS